MAEPSFERGQTTPLTVAVVFVMVTCVFAAGAVGGRAVDAARSRSAADATALAAVGAGVPAARLVAGANGAELENVDHLGDTVVVTTRHRGHRTTAAAVAEREPAAGPLEPALVAALARAEDLLGEPIPIVSGWRSTEEQRRLWDQRHTSPYPVAPPGTSDHELGRAVDVPAWFVDRLRSVAPRAGLCQPLPVSDPVHFTACRTTATR